MKIEAAVLRSSATERPYDLSRPLGIEEVELDAPGHKELLVRVVAAGICHSDLSVVDGSRPRPLPLALGHEGAGVVEAVGPGVADVQVGDHVVLTFVPSCGVCATCLGGSPALCGSAALANRDGCLLGGHRRLRPGEGVLHHHLGVSAFATHVVVSRSSAVVVPRNVSLEIAAVFGCAVLTGIGAVLESGRVRPGQSVAVFGLGGVGLAAVMGAVLGGAYPVVGIDPIASKRELARELGAETVLAPEDAESGTASILPGGVDCAVETAGRAEALSAAYRVTARGGTTVAVGLPDPDASITINPAQLVGDGRSLRGSYMGDAVPQRDIPRLVSLWEAGRLPVDRLVGDARPLALSEINHGLEALAAGSALRQIVRP